MVLFLEDLYNQCILNRVIILCIKGNNSMSVLAMHLHAPSYRIIDTTYKNPSEIIPGLLYNKHEALNMSSLFVYATQASITTPLKSLYGIFLRKKIIEKNVKGEE